MIVHANVYDPSRSIFKGSNNDKAECQTIDCSNHENCELLKRGECAIRSGLFGGSCPHGKYHKETGYTRRARAFHGWISERKEKYKGVAFLDAPKRLGSVGDAIYLPYPHMKDAVGLFSDNLFIPLSQFTVENVKRLCERRPQAMMGGEITSYQAEIVPKFVMHLSESMPKLYTELCKTYPRAAKLMAEHSNIGRKALLSTVVPNGGVLTDIHGGNWIWDGEYLTMTNRKASFMLVDHSEVRIKPIEGETVKICSEHQVSSKTVFVD